MPSLQREAIVAAPIHKVWLFFTDPVKNLPRISPASSAIVIESADLPLKEGSQLAVSGKDPLGRRFRFVSQITEFVPPKAVVFGMEARFTDVQVSGPFKSWSHSHEFEALDSQTTRVVDRVSYEVAGGALSRIASWLPLRWYISGMLRHRQRAIKELLEQP